MRIINNTKLTLSLTFNNTKHKFYPEEEQTLSLLAGKYTFYASAPDVIPNYGIVIFGKNVLYE
ncbi:MAG: hypothetical protein ACP5P3_06075 [Ignavibacteria bacterium]